MRTAAFGLWILGWTAGCAPPSMIGLARWRITLSTSLPARRPRNGAHINLPPRTYGLRLTTTSNCTAGIVQSKICRAFILLRTATVELLPIDRIDCGY